MRDHAEVRQERLEWARRVVDRPMLDLWLIDDRVMDLTARCFISSNGNLGRTAKRLGRSPRWLQLKMDRWVSEGRGMDAEQHWLKGSAPVRAE